MACCGGCKGATIPPGCCLPAGTAVGQILVWDGTAWVPSTNSGAVLSFGTLTLGATASSYLFPWNGTINTPPTRAAAGELVVPRAGTLRNFVVYHANPGGAANNITYTLYLNGVATGIVLALNVTAAGPASNIVSTLPVARFDRLAVEAVQGGAVVVTTQRPEWSCELAA